MTSTIIFQVQSFLIVALMLYGVSKRKVRYLHVKIMRTVIIWDLLLVAQIELTRSAINTASKAMENHWLLNVHISFAVSTVLLYFAIMFTGQKLLKGNEEIRKYHKVLGVTTLTLRILTLITSNLIRGL
jgi:hydrogenase-4 membrane subunit HyfE